MSAWPAGLVARYLTVGGAAVDLFGPDPVNNFGGPCGGCGQQVSNRRSDPDSPQAGLADARGEAQAHAKQCRAVPQPEAGGR
ncbi:hypothetical protein ACFYMO_03810 [Streptomyces sp. NPDC007025]|uniref:hypothetical protein n=1 Tax=Streptomyces sp. NPDC007025 TaxID=3364771 RepID=UPI00368EDC5A